MYGTFWHDKKNQVHFGCHYQCPYIINHLEWYHLWVKLSWVLKPCILFLSAPANAQIVHSGQACVVKEDNISERIYTIREGDTLVLQCLVKGHPRPQVHTCTLGVNVRPLHIHHHSQLAGRRAGLPSIISQPLSQCRAWGGRDERTQMSWDHMASSHVAIGMWFAKPKLRTPCIALLVRINPSPKSAPDWPITGPPIHRKTGRLTITFAFRFTALSLLPNALSWIRFWWILVAWCIPFRLLTGPLYVVFGLGDGCGSVDTLRTWPVFT